MSVSPPASRYCAVRLTSGSGCCESKADKRHTKKVKEARLRQIMHDRAEVRAIYEAKIKHRRGEENDIYAVQTKHRVLPRTLGRWLVLQQADGSPSGGGV